jgi:hypothetical protein
MANVVGVSEPATVCLVVCNKVLQCLVPEERCVHRLPHKHRTEDGLMSNGNFNFNLYACGPTRCAGSPDKFCECINVSNVPAGNVPDIEISKFDFINQAE